MVAVNGSTFPFDNDLTEPLLPNKTNDKLYKFFMERFNEDWTNKDVAFSYPRNRAFACTTMIELLLKQERLNEAFELFRSARDRGAWNAEIGFSFDKTKAEKCQKCFDETKKLLQSYGFDMYAED